MRDRCDPFEQVDRLLAEMRRDAWSRPSDDRNASNRQSGAGLPDHDSRRHGAGHALTLEETDDEYVVVADLPGFETDEIDLRYEDDRLRIEGTHEVSEGTDTRNRTVRESVTVPGEVVVDEIIASYHNGVLEVRLPVASESSSAHRIEID